MKKIISVLLALVLCLSVLPMTATAEQAGASFTGPSTVRSGNSITLIFAVQGTGILGVQGQLSYDENQVTLVDTEVLAEDPWMVEFGKTNVVAYDNAQNSPINESTKLFSVTFKVKQLNVGTQVNISMKNVILSDFSDFNIGDVTYSVTISAAESTNNKLQSLEISNAEIKPAFDPNVTSYTAEVPYSVSKLIIKALQADKATVKISNPTLQAGGTTKVTITVTAESGAKRVYTITVTRTQDPNYEPSGNNDLSGIKVDGFYLSPGFTKENTNYVIWLPYEIDRVSVSGTAEDSKASVRVEGGNDLLAGKDNVIKVICVAENGSEKVYTIIAKRAAGHGQTEPTEPTVPTEPTKPTEPTTPTIPVPPTTKPVDPTIPVVPSTSTTLPTVPTDPTESSTVPTDPSGSTAANSTGKPTDSTTKPVTDPGQKETSILLILIYVIIAIIALCGILVCLMFVIGMRSKGKYAKKRKRTRK